MPNLKTKVNNLDVDKLKAVSVDLSELHHVVDKDRKKNVYDQLVIKVTATDTKILNRSQLVSKTHYDSDKKVLEKKIEDVDKRITDTNGLVKKADYNTKVTEIENKITSVTG